MQRKKVQERGHRLEREALAERHTPCVLACQPTAVPANQKISDLFAALVHDGVTQGRFSTGGGKLGATRPSKLLAGQLTLISVLRGELFLHKASNFLKGASDQLCASLVSYTKHSTMWWGGGAAA